MTNSNKKYDVIVIGAGAAGLIAAGRAAEQGAKVLLIERNEKIGRKLLITGKGRCNISNEAYLSEYFKQIHPNGKFLKYAFSQFFVKDIVSLLSSYGVDTKVERGGRIFPQSDKSSDVVNALYKYVKKNDVEILLNCRISKLIKEDKTITGVEYRKSNKTEQILASKVILCTGGCSYPATGSSGDGYKITEKLGHKIENLRPALVPLETEGDIAEKLQGLSLKNVNATIWVNGKKKKEEFGEMLFAHFGLTGPIILTLSRLVVDEINLKSKIEISIDLKPALDRQKLDNRLQRDLNENGKKQVRNIFKNWLPSKLIPVFFELTQISETKECNQISAKERIKILNLMKDFRFNISGHRPFKEAIITAGGINTTEINSKTMESKLIKNLYFAGEIIDLDANTGGYNLQIAYSTGWLAGSCADTLNIQEK